MTTAKYRKKPITIEAEQWFPGKFVKGVQEIVFEDGDIHSTQRAGYGMIDTLEGPLKVSPGDWIITGVAGERYPCKPEIFVATYDPESADAPSKLPAKPGFYWALWLTAAEGTHEGDQLTPARNWEVVEVWENFEGEPCEADAAEKFGVSVLGVREAQWLHNFKWGAGPLVGP